MNPWAKECVKCGAEMRATWYYKGARRLARLSTGEFGEVVTDTEMLVWTCSCGWSVAGPTVEQKKGKGGA